MLPGTLRFLSAQAGILISARCDWHHGVLGLQSPHAMSEVAWAGLL